MSIKVIINKIFNEDNVGTKFYPTEESLSGKKRWIGYATNVIGKIIVNEGAKKYIRPYAKDADIVIYEGNPLEINSEVKATVINGEIVWRN